jgi:hypothetical protein
MNFKPGDIVLHNRKDEYRVLNVTSQFVEVEDLSGFRNQYLLYGGVTLKEAVEGNGYLELFA